MSEEIEEKITEAKRLTPKQKMWLQAYGDIDNPNTLGNATRSALVAYYPDFPIDKNYEDLTEEEKTQYNGAKQMGWENLTKLDIPVKELMNAMGLTDSKILGKLGELLISERPYGKDGVLHADNGARAKAVEISLKLRKLLTDKVEVDLSSFFLKKKIKIEIVEPREVDQTIDNDGQAEA